MLLILLHQLIIFETHMVTIVRIQGALVGMKGIDSYQPSYLYAEVGI